ncbi:MAG: hypothetical protein AAFW75_02890 [Cyanobacteria bacterium J06636_16]
MTFRIVFLGISLFLYGLAQSLLALRFHIIPKGLSGKYIPSGELNAYGKPIDIVAMRGIELSTCGILGIMFLVIPALAWLANPAYLISSLCFVRQQYKCAAVASLMAVLIGFLGTISSFWIRLPNGSSPYTQLVLAEVLSGFWVWLSAPAIVALASIVRLTQTR